MNPKDNKKLLEVHSAGFETNQVLWFSFMYRVKLSHRLFELVLRIVISHSTSHTGTT